MLQGNLNENVLAAGRDTMDVIVARRSVEADGICSLEMVHPEGKALPRFTAGAHVDVHIPGGHLRQYSLCNDPDETQRYVIGVLRDPNSRGGSAALHDAVSIGDRLKISTPRNQFELARASSSIFFAGGIGVTPILAMARQLARENMQYAVHYCVRSAMKAAFSSELENIVPWGRLKFHFDDGAEEQRLDIDLTLDRTPRDTHIYVCGPKGFIDWIVGSAQKHGWRPEQVHVEYFKAEVRAADGDTPFEIRLSRSGQTYIVPAGVPAASVLIEAGHKLPISCESGFCGTCLTRVLEGIPDHRDTYLTDVERERNDQFTPCCSRAQSKTLLIDL